MNESKLREGMAIACHAALFGDAVGRLALADWLEEQGMPDMAISLRIGLPPAGELRIEAPVEPFTRRPRWSYSQRRELPAERIEGARAIVQLDLGTAVANAIARAKANRGLKTESNGIRARIKRGKPTKEA